jgi:hypothetical protein
VRKYVFLVGASALLGALVMVPLLPRGTDLYVHVLWPWQVMRCLADGALPLWFPDLNAGFGSPGIGLYSPFSPALCGVLGLVLGGSGLGVRAALVLALTALSIIAPGRNVKARVVAVVLVVFSPALVIEFFGRFPVAQLLAVPFAWLLLERAVDNGWRWYREGICLAVLWLFHAPTTVMVGAVALVAALFGVTTLEETGEVRISSPIWERVDAAGRLSLTCLVAAGLTAWHWWPLLANSGHFQMSSALIGGEHHPVRNAIGIPDPHLFEINVAMGWAAVGLLGALLLSRGWETRRGCLAIAAVTMASWLTLPLWSLPSPLTWLQFPWRWMLPATLLAAPVLAGRILESDRLTSLAILLAVFLPLVTLPPPKFVVDPSLTVRTSPLEAGRAVMASFSGNPYLVDVREHRPLWWKDLAPTMAELGSHQVVLVPDKGVALPIEWKPLSRVISVTTPEPATIIVRLLADDRWEATINGMPVETFRWGAALAVRVPGGRSRLEVQWQIDPRAIAGVLGAVILLGWIYLYRRSSRFRGE